MNKKNIDVGICNRGFRDWVSENKDNSKNEMELKLFLENKQCSDSTINHIMKRIKISKKNFEKNKKNGKISKNEKWNWKLILDEYMNKEISGKGKHSRKLKQ